MGRTMAPGSSKSSEPLSTLIYELALWFVGRDDRLAADLIMAAHAAYLREKAGGD